MQIEFSHRIKSLPPYLFAELDKKIAEKKKEGKEIISFGVGDPDLPTPEHIVKACCEAAKKPENHRYPSYEGMLEFREAVAERCKRDYGLSLDPEREIIALIGSKEGIHNFPFAFVDPGDYVLCPDPGYPVYKTSAIFACAKPYAMPLKKENNFLPDLDKIPSEVARKAKIMWINYPNNPTSAIATKDFYREVIDFAQDYNIIVASDEAYSKMTFDDYKAPSFLEVEGAYEVGIVFDSLSKTYNMTGWRIAYAFGNEKIINGLKKVKTNVDSGVSQIIQEAAIVALTSSQDCIRETLKIYQTRRDLLYSGLRELGLKCEKPRATFYLWVEVPEGKGSIEFATELLDKAGVVCTPGVGFGEHGEGFVRFALTQNEEKIKKALKKMREVM